MDMGSIISVTNLSFSYGKRQVFKNLNFDIEKGSFVTIIGPMASGKTTLIRLLSGLEDSKDSILINGSKTTKRALKQVGVVFNIEEAIPESKTVMQEIIIKLSSSPLKGKTLETKIADIFNELEITSLLQRNPRTLSVSDKYLINLAIIILLKYEVIIIDSDMNFSNAEKDVVLDLLRRLARLKGTTIIYATNDTNDLLYSNQTIILNNGKIVIKDETYNVLNMNNILEDNHLIKPFVCQLSDKLKFYNAVDKTYYNMHDMVDSIWK